MKYIKIAKYKENKTISEIALELNISEKEVIEILNEIVEII